MSRPTRESVEGRAYLNLQNMARRDGRPRDELLPGKARGPNRATDPREEKGPGCSMMPSSEADGGFGRDGHVGLVHRRKWLGRSHFPTHDLGLRRRSSGTTSSGIARRMNLSNWGTVKAAYPCSGV